MMERIGDHLTYLAKYATGSTPIQDSEEVHKVHLTSYSFIVLLIGLYLQALVAAYCDLLSFYVKVRKLFPHTEGTLSCR